MGWKVRCRHRKQHRKERAKHLTVLSGHVLTGVSVGVIPAPLLISICKNEWCPGKDGNLNQTQDFTVKEIEYDENRNISKLIIVDRIKAPRVIQWAAMQHQRQQSKPKEKHVAGYDEFCKLAKIITYRPAEITKYIVGTFKKPKLALLGSIRNDRGA